MADTFGARDVGDLQTASALLLQGRWADARDLLDGLLARAPALADARRLLGLALRNLGDAVGAEAALRAALSLSPSSGPTAYALCDLLLSQGRAEEALAIIGPLASAPAADFNLLTAQGEALKGLGRLVEAHAVYRRAGAAAPRSAVADHNLAGVLGDLERFAESEASARAAVKKGLDAPETWLVLARALVGQGRKSEAESAYHAVIDRRPDHVDAHAELAQLVWMQTADIAAAARRLDTAIAAFPDLQALRLKKAELLQAAGDLDAAYAAVADVVSRSDAQPMMHVIAARVSMQPDPGRALWHAQTGVRLLPGDPVAESTLAEALFAVGDAAEAVGVAERMYAIAPLDQHVLAILATAWRLTGDTRYGELYDYRLVRTWRIDTPAGWSTLDAYLADLTVALGRLHAFRTHPIGQSVRHGSQTSQRLTLSTDPTIQAFFTAVDEPIRRHIAALGPGKDPLRSRIAKTWEFNGEWSVRLTGSGHHANHVHPRGWLSSACYIALPRVVGAGGKEGWLKFGEPGVVTAPPLTPEYFVKPEPGLLALFPSYMWHGTVPFSGEETRLTIAFDVVPG